MRESLSKACRGSKVHLNWIKVEMVVGKILTYLLIKDVFMSLMNQVLTKKPICNRSKREKQSRQIRLLQKHLMEEM